MAPRPPRRRLPGRARGLPPGRRRRDEGGRGRGDLAQDAPRRPQRGGRAPRQGEQVDPQAEPRLPPGPAIHPGARRHDADAREPQHRAGLEGAREDREHHGRQPARVHAHLQPPLRPGHHARATRHLHRPVPDPGQPSGPRSSRRRGSPPRGRRRTKRRAAPPTSSRDWSETNPKARSEAPTPARARHKTTARTRRRPRLPAPAPQ